MPKLKYKTDARKRMEQRLNDCLMQLTKLNISKSEVVRKVSFWNLGIQSKKRLSDKQKFDRVNAALIKGHFVNEVFARRVVAASLEAIEEHMEKVEGVKKEETSFLLEPIDPLV